jgi:D-amino-acid dehydrogenase
MWKFWRECTAEKAALNTRRKVRLCNYSQSVMHETVRRAAIDYAARQGGLIYFYGRRSPSRRQR